MPPISKISSFLIILLLASTVSVAQFHMEQPVIISEKQGLITNDVRLIRKGKDGFVWMATIEGLCRFDGQQAKMYRHEKDITAGPFDNFLQTVLPLENEIWMGTSQGISVMSTVTEKFRHYQFGDNKKADTVYRRFNQGVNVLFLDRDKNIWIGSRENGVWMYDKKNDELKNFPYAESEYHKLVPTLGPQTSTLTIGESKTNDSIIWAGTPGGLEKINKYTGKVKWYTFPLEDKKRQVALNAVRRVFPAKNGLIYVGSWEAGLNVFDPVKETFTPLPVKPHPAQDFLKAPIGTLNSKNDDELWITSSHGVLIYNIPRQEITWYKRNQPMDSKYYGLEYIDDAGRIWHSDINGVQYFDPLSQQFPIYSYQHLYPKDWVFSFYIISDPTGNLITVGPRTADGLYRFNKLTNEWTKYPFHPASADVPGKIATRGLIPLGNENYLMSSDEGLFEYSIKTGILKHSSIKPSVRYNRWGDILKDSKGNIWVSADADGLIKWNLKTGESRIYKNELEITFTDNVLGRAHNFLEDSKGNIWLSRQYGLSVYLADRDTIINFLYNRYEKNTFPVIAGMAEDRKGRIWVSSNDYRYGYIDVNKPENGIVEKFDLKAQGINEGLDQLATDKTGFVWGYTSKKLIRLDKSNEPLQTFDFAYGAKAIEFFHFSFLNSGEMVFGARNSIMLADPRTFNRNTELPVPYISGMQVLNEQVPVAFYSGKRVDLKPRQNFFSISFSSKAFTMPEHVRFRYRLKNFDEWTETRERRFANYTNVPPGDYTFQLQVANNEGMWNPEILEMPVHITTAWWRTWVFRIALLLAVSGIIYWMYRYRISQVKKKEKVKTQYEKKLANVEMSALLAQMNPHFLFNSLNSIDSYIIRNESKKASEYLNNFARLMRLILQNSRTNYISLKDELEALDLYLQMESLRFANRFNYEIKIGEEVDPASTLIPPMLIQPYVENAIWHGLMHKNNGMPGKVELRINKPGDSLVCVIEDNGIGRAKAEELRAHKSANRKRSMGMQITRDRIEMINKLYNTNTTVQVIDLDDNGHATGTRVELTIPV